jgi:hypothetical protein
MLRVWDRAAHRCIAKAHLDTWVRAASYSPDGKFIAVGTGGRLGGLIPEINGAFYVLDSTTLRTVARGQESKRAISEVCCAHVLACALRPLTFRLAAALLLCR